MIKTFLLEVGTAALFVDTKNIVYGASYDSLFTVPPRCGYIYKWPDGNSSAETMIYSEYMTDIQSLFVSENGDIYAYDYEMVDSDSLRWFEKKHDVIRWSSCPIVGVSVMNVTDNCYGLFIDLNSTLYCSVRDKHQVLRKSLLTNAALSPIGTIEGNQLNEPQGIFVDANFSLYVADTGNNRIQYFSAGQKKRNYQNWW